MKILLDGYRDRNLGDDLMLALARDGLKEHEVFTDKSRPVDVYLKVTGSGFLIHNNLGILYRLRDMYREKRYAPMKAVINCNISQFINRAAEKAVLKQLKDFDFITVRDTFSYDYIRNNIPDVRCEKYPDMVFSLPDSMIPDTPCENLLGIAVHNSMDCVKTAHAADGYTEETGNGVLLLCFDTGMENDTLAAERVRSASKYKDKIEIVPYENIPDMLSQIKRCSVILGARLHSIVLAARMGIPFVPLAYSDKTPHALYDTGYKKEIYRAEGFDVRAVLERVLTEAPHDLGGDITRLASEHMIKFNEFIKKQI